MDCWAHLAQVHSVFSRRLHSVHWHVFSHFAHIYFHHKLYESHTHKKTEEHTVLGVFVCLSVCFSGMAVGLYVLVFLIGGDCSGSLLVQVLQKSPAYFLCEDHGLHCCG